MEQTTTAVFFGTPFFVRNKQTSPCRQIIAYAAIKPERNTLGPYHDIATPSSAITCALTWKSSALFSCISTTSCFIEIGNSDNNDDNDNEEEEGDTTNNIFAALPPIGASSFWDRQDEDSQDINTNNLSSNNIVVSRKFHLSYTCKHKDCNTRNTHSITRLGYNHGVVIAVCKCCKAKHLIADNLGWSNYLVSGFDYDGGERNIEAYVKNRQEESGDDSVGSLRVDRGVFDLESLWHEEKENSEAAVVVDDEDWN
eukprot:scaffold34616_cov159-Skeletonema_dohrnii-CCMP3373.AAC.2